eukprot:NODE_435_length_1566_cov_350.129715.p1 GENE.NODE_435_length_1566_cov_350.129715~~NODE_435_length_1566_cov_350.129715.p1  ORF type:complete len:331 (+),score=88.06 NODE_435_length_1566_cov_350.129715:3-995(+)
MGRMKASRVWRGYVNKIIITMSLVSLAVIFAFEIPHEKLPERLGHCTTLFLTAVAFQLVVSGNLPQIDYMTLIDKYILSVNTYILINMAIMTAIFQFEIRDTFERDNTETIMLAEVNQYIMVFAFMVWAGMHVHFFANAAYVTRRYEIVKKTQADSFSKLDEVKHHATRARYSIPQGNGRVIFGNVDDYQEITGVYKDTTFWTGMWYTDVFGRQHVDEYITIEVAKGTEDASYQLIARKVTGFSNSPAGLIIIRTMGALPEINGPEVPIEVCEVDRRGEAFVEGSGSRIGYRWTGGAFLTARHANELELSGHWRGTLKRLVASSFHDDLA